MADIYFRTDGNNKIATGHLMRCLAIARACIRKGAKVKFVVSDKQSFTLLQERFISLQEFEVYCLNSDYTNLLKELPALSALAIQKSTADTPKPWIFVDSYYANPVYLMTLRKNFRVAYLDDLRSFDCPVELVINYDTNEDCDYYAKADRKLLGAQYTPLREQFNNTVYTVRPTVEHVLLSTGGTDPYGVAEHLLKKIYQSTQILQSMHYHILTGSANTRYADLVSFARTHPNIHIHEGVSDVASLMASCDLAVCAGGTTLCELCAVGVPSISYLMAENQRMAVETYAGLGLIPCAGDIRPQTCNARNLNSDMLPPINHTTVSAILSFMTNMSQNLSARKESSQSMRAFLNGAGADQIACELTS